MEILMDILYEMDLDSAAIGALSWMLGALLVVAVIALAVSLVTYILQAAGIYAMAKRRGVKHAWLAWIPIGQYWVAGSLSDQYKQSVKGKSSYNRTVMLILALVGWVVSLLAGTTALSGLLRMVTSLVNGDMEAYAYASTLTSGGSQLLSLLNNGLSIALFVFWQISLYDIYSSCNPKYNVLFLVLGILFQITVPFFLFCSRKKDEGMRIPKAQEPVYQSYETYDY